MRTIGSWQVFIVVEHQHTHTVCSEVTHLPLWLLHVFFDSFIFANILFDSYSKNHMWQTHRASVYVRAQMREMHDIIYMALRREHTKGLYQHYNACNRINANKTKCQMNGKEPTMNTRETETHEMYRSPVPPNVEKRWKFREKFR